MTITTLRFGFVLAVFALLSACATVAPQYPASFPQKTARLATMLMSQKYLMLYPNLNHVANTEILLNIKFMDEIIMY